jgi:hypothetical protein
MDALFSASEKILAHFSPPQSVTALGGMQAESFSSSDVQICNIYSIHMKHLFQMLEICKNAL